MKKKHKKIYKSPLVKIVAVVALLIGGYYFYNSTLDAEDYFNRGNANAELGKYEKAIKDYNKSIKLDPRFTEAYYNSGLIMFEVGLYEAAIEYFNIVIKLNPEEADTYHIRAQAKWALGQPKEAIKDFEKSGKIKLKALGVLN